MNERREDKAMNDDGKWQDPEVSEVDELVADERRRMASKGTSSGRSWSVAPWIIAVVVLAAAALVLWAVLGS